MTPQERREDRREAVKETLFLIVCVVLLVAFSWWLA